MRLTDEELVALFMEHRNYSLIARILGVRRNVIAYRVNKLRSGGMELPPVIRHTEESKRMIGQTNRDKFGEDIYKIRGSIGGKINHTGGFYKHRELARIAGRKGGRISKRRKYDNRDEELL